MRFRLEVVRLCPRRVVEVTATSNLSNHLHFVKLGDQDIIHLQAFLPLPMALLNLQVLPLLHLADLSLFNNEFRACRCDGHLSDVDLHSQFMNVGMQLVVLMLCLEHQ